MSVKEFLNKHLSIIDKVDNNWQNRQDTVSPLVIDSHCSFERLLYIGAGAIELAGARAPQISDSGGTGAQQNLWGTYKKNKKINEKARYSAKEVFSVSSLGNGHTATHQQLCRSPCVLCRRRQQLHTASIRRHPVNAILNQPLYFVVDWIRVWCTRVDGRKYLKTIQNCENNAVLSQK